MEEKPILQLNNITKKFKKFTALDNLNMTVQKGDIYGFIGPNGAGKTTTIKIVSGLLENDYGEIVLNGKSVGKGSRFLKDFIGYVPDYFGFYDNLEVIEYMEFFASAYGLDDKYSEKIIDELLTMVNLKHKENDYVDSLSRGMKNRLCLARALIHNPTLLLLDEPLEGLDPNSRYEYKSILKALVEYGKTIVLSSHIMPEIQEMCTRIGIINEGHMIAQGSIGEILDMADKDGSLLIRVNNNADPAVNILREYDSVKSISVDGNNIMVNLDGDSFQSAAILKKLIENDVEVYSYSKEESSLESLYLKIIGK